MCTCELLMVDDADIHQSAMALVSEFTVTNLIFLITYHGALSSRRIFT